MSNEDVKAFVSRCKMTLEQLNESAQGLKSNATDLLVKEVTILMEKMQPHVDVGRWERHRGFLNRQNDLTYCQERLDRAMQDWKSATDKEIAAQRRLISTPIRPIPPSSVTSDPDSPFIPQPINVENTWSAERISKFKANVEDMRSWTVAKGIERAKSQTRAASSPSTAKPLTSTEQEFELSSPKFDASLKSARSARRTPPLPPPPKKLLESSPRPRLSRKPTPGNFPAIKLPETNLPHATKNSLEASTSTSRTSPLRRLFFGCVPSSKSSSPPLPTRPRTAPEPQMRANIEKTLPRRRKALEPPNRPSSVESSPESSELKMKTSSKGSVVSSGDSSFGSSYASSLSTGSSVACSSCCSPFPSSV